jgi:hypothetical protein
MSFDKPTRNKLASMVGDCRRLLTDDIRHQLQAVYGLQPDGTALPVPTLSHLDERGREVAGALRLWQEHLASTEAGTETQKNKAAFDRLAHETAFTILNRLAALRMCEERGHVIECVRRGLESDGFALYERFSEGVLGGRGQTYRIFLERMFAELSVDLGALFDLDAPQSLVFPRERCLEEVLSFLNSADLAHVWANDETIGWIYQYFNSKEEREAMREASAAPRNSRELAVRNQFFTPRYVVEFLVDNTLGRLWYEMRQGETALKETCHYLVRRASEIFLSQGQQTPSSANARKDLSQDELVKQPVYIPYRAKRDPRTLKILDPAVGSGHFLLYAFDLLEAIYQEAWGETNQPIFEATGKTLREEYADLNILRIALPQLILRHNLHGIDIDLRACQIAALALWLRAQHAYQHLGLKSAQRPRIDRSNIVCAEPMPGEQALLDEFLTDLEPRIIGQLVQVAFEKMKLAGEAGSLLKIEEEIADAVADAKQKWLAGPKPGQGLLFTDARPQQTALLLDFSGVTTETFWERAEERIYVALRGYAEHAENGHGYRRRLFANDTARGFAFIDLCRQRYDVALMNPPFGAASKDLQDILERNRFHARDLAADFVTNAIRMLVEGGLMGAITTRTIFFLKGFIDWRDALVRQTGGPPCFLDIGFGALDAAVETSAFTLQRATNGLLGTYFKAVGLNQQLDLQGPVILSQCLKFVVDARTFGRIPRHPFAYWVSPVVLNALDRLPSIGDQFEVLSGGNPRDDFRFVRHWVEIPSALARDFVPYSKGGDFALYYYDVHLMLNWKDDGRELKAHAAEYRRSLGWSPDWRALMMNYDHYFTAAITWPRRTSRLSFRFLPKGCVFGDKSPVIITKDGDLAPLLSLIAYLNTAGFSEILNLMVGSTELAQSFEVGIVKSCPLPTFDSEMQSSRAIEIFRRLLAMDSLNEESHAFLGFWSPLTPSQSLRTTFNELVEQRREAISDILDRQIELEDASRSALGTARSEPQTKELTLQEIKMGTWTSGCVSYLVGASFGRWDIRLLAGASPRQGSADPFAPLPVCPPGMLQSEQGQPLTRENVRHLEATDLWHYPTEIPWDGILLDDPDNANDIVRRVRRVLTVLWQEHAETIEQEACDILEVKDLREYFRRPALFFADHLRRYSKSRRQAPIYWPLSTASGSYTLWIYYHRLNDDSLYTALNKYVKPKIDDTEKELRRIESELPNATGREVSSLRTALEEIGVFLDELRELRDELARVADLPYKPNLNDGVLITASPLWKLFRLPKWRKELQDCWKKLESGDYDWAHLAYSIWPDRVRDVCKSNRSIAIAHDLESLCELAAKPAKKKRSKKIAVEETVRGDEE